MNMQQPGSAPAPPPAPAPPGGSMPPPAAPAPQPAPGGGFGGMPFPGMMGAPPPASGPLAALRNHPKFNQLRYAVQSNPQVLNMALSQIAATDPSLIPLIAENQDEFVEALQEPVT